MTSLSSSRSIRSLGVTLIGLLASATLASATTVVDESFTYVDGNVDGLNGGTGWSNAWQTGNSVPAVNRFDIVSNQALYQGGGSGQNTEQNRTFSAPLTSNVTESIAVNFTLVYNETQAGRGIGIYLTNGGVNQFFIGKRVNSTVGLHSSMNGGSNYRSFANTGSAEPITATITYNGTDTSIVVSDSDESLAAYTVPGTLTFDGISLAGYNGATTTNGVDDILVTTTTNPDAWLQVASLAQFTSNGAATVYSVPIFNHGATQTLNISSVIATGFDSGDVSGISFPATLAPLTGGTIDFTFDPSSVPDLYYFDLEISSNDASAGSPRIVSVEVDVAEPLIEIDTTALAFGAFANNPGPQSLSVNVTNNGGSLPLVISSADITGSSAFTVTSAPASIAPGATAPIEVTFNPGTQPGNFSGTLTIVSDDFNNTTPTVALSASTAFGGTLLANYTFGTPTTLVLTSADTALGSTAGTLVKTELAGNATDVFGTRVSTSTLVGTVDGNGFGWSRREAPNSGLDLSTTAPNHAVTFTLTPVPGYTVDLTTDGWLTVDIAAFSSLAGATSYTVGLTVDDGINPAFTLGPVTGAAVPGAGNVKNMVTFDVRSLGSITAPVTFSVMPQTTGNTNGQISQAGGYLDNITLSGTETAPPSPQLVVTSPAVLSDEGLGGPLSIPIQNLGGANLTITSVTTDGSGAFATISNITFDTPLTALGGAGNINFDFMPNAGPGLYTTNLTVVSNDPGSPTTIALEITVRDPEILVANPTVSFGPLPNNPGVQTLNLVVTNDGESSNLVISGTTITGSGTFTQTSLPGPIAPGATGNIEITFTPGAAVGRLNASMTIQSNDFDGTEPVVKLTGFVQPAGTVVSRFDFDPSSHVSDAPLLDVDGSAMTNWTSSDLIDAATGIGAVSAGNQAADNRAIATGVNGNYLRFSSNRESDAQTPTLPAANNESTWSTFTVTPDAGGGAIDFTGGTAIIDTYANTSLGTNTAANWTLYYLLDGASSWVSLGTSAGAATTNGESAPVSLTWSLNMLGNQTAPVQFLLDPVSTGGTNGTAGQRGIGFDNLILTAGSITPGSGGGFSTWASGFGIPNDPNYDATDHDGNVALVEYALGLSPLVSEGAPGTLVGGKLTFTKGAVAVANGDVNYSIESSPNLVAPWTPVSYVLPDVNDGTTISYTLPTGLGKIFARLVVTKTP